MSSKTLHLDAERHKIKDDVGSVTFFLFVCSFVRAFFRSFFRSFAYFFWFFLGGGGGRFVLVWLGNVIMFELK